MKRGWKKYHNDLRLLGIRIQNHRETLGWTLQELSNRTGITKGALHEDETKGMRVIDTRIGQQMGNYHLTRLLGRGGFAEVYLGEHVQLYNMRVAIKVLQNISAKQDVQRFRDEAQVLVDLKHYHIVRLLEYGVAKDTTPYLVMDYAPGGTLRQKYPRGTQVPLDLIVSYVQQVAGALQAAHNKKVIHCDIKPDNMLLGENDEVLLSDFGIATIAHSIYSYSTQELGDRKGLVGTISYMAPEQILGNPHPASDQYALGIVVYEWLTGICPFTGSYYKVMSQHLSAEPHPFAKKLHIPSSVEAVVRKALRKEPEQRFRSVQAFADALEQASQQPMIDEIPIASLLPDIMDAEIKALGFSDEPQFIRQPNPTPIAPVVAPSGPVKQAVVLQKVEKKSVSTNLGDFSIFLSRLIPLNYKFRKNILIFDVIIIPMLLCGFSFLLLGSLSTSWWLFLGSFLWSLLAFVITWSIGNTQNYKRATIAVSIFAILWGLLGAVFGLWSKTIDPADYITITIVLSIVDIVVSGWLHLIIVPNFYSFMMGKDNAKQSL